MKLAKHVDSPAPKFEYDEFRLWETRCNEWLENVGRDCLLYVCEDLTVVRQPDKISCGPSVVLYVAWLEEGRVKDEVVKEGIENNDIKAFYRIFDKTNCRKGYTDAYDLSRYLKELFPDRKIKVRGEFVPAYTLHPDYKKSMDFEEMKEMEAEIRDALKNVSDRLKFAYFSSREEDKTVLRKLLSLRRTGIDVDYGMEEPEGEYVIWMKYGSGGSKHWNCISPQTKKLSNDHIFSSDPLGCILKFNRKVFRDEFFLNGNGICIEIE